MRNHLCYYRKEGLKANTEPLYTWQMQVNLRAKLQDAEVFKLCTTAHLMSTSRVCVMTYLFHIPRWNNPGQQSEA